jgi:hypothetical protein
MQAPREAIYDAETGEELTHVRSTWRKKPKRKGKPERVETTPDIPPDETGVTIDGGNRIAVGADGLGGVMESEAVPLAEESVKQDPENTQDYGAKNEGGEARPDDEGGNQNAEPDHDAASLQSSGPIDTQAEPSQMSEEDLAVLYELATSSDDDRHDENAEAEANEETHEPIHNEPQTNPARLLAAAE